MIERSYWNSTQKILVVTKFTSLDEIHAYRSAIKDVQLNVNDCAIIALTSSKKEAKALTEIHSVVFASEQEINVLGKWKNEAVTKELGRFYDVVLVVGEHPSKVLKFIKRTKCTISVGINTNADFLTIRLSTEDKSPQHLLNFTKQTLEKII